MDLFSSNYKGIIRLEKIENEGESLASETRRAKVQGGWLVQIAQYLVLLLHLCLIQNFLGL